MIMNIIEEIKKLNIGEVYENVDLIKYNTYRVSGNASGIVIPDDTEALITLLKLLRRKNIKHKILGNGSNLIFANDSYDGILIKLDSFQNINIEENKITVGAGYPLIKLALKASRAGLTGLEFATGIPGTVGGAVFMNAGAYKSDMGYVVTSVKVLTPDYEVRTMINKELNFHYRTSFIKENPEYVCLEATIILSKGNKEDILELVEERKQRRIESQPLEYPSAGSVFRNPEGDYAGRLIEELGYKGKGINDAIVSEKHANFIVNLGNAKGSEIKELIDNIKKDVIEKYNINLKLEQEIVE